MPKGDEKMDVRHHRHKHMGWKWGVVVVMVMVAWLMVWSMDDLCYQIKVLTRWCPVEDHCGELE